MGRKMVVLAGYGSVLRHLRTLAYSMQCPDHVVELIWPRDQEVTRRESDTQAAFQSTQAVAVIAALLICRRSRLYSRTHTNKRPTHSCFPAQRWASSSSRQIPCPPPPMEERSRVGRQTRDLDSCLPLLSAMTLSARYTRPTPSFRLTWRISCNGGSHGVAFSASSNHSVREEEEKHRCC